MRSVMCAGVVVSACGLLCASASGQPCSPLEFERVVAADGDVGDNYGWAVAIDGHTAVVGALREDAIGFESGSVYVLEFNGTHWNQTQKLVGLGIGSSDGFGDSVAISGDTIVVGTPGDDDIETNSGAAYIYTNINGTWTQTDKLIAPGVVGGDNYASVVDIDGDTIVMGASLTDTMGSKLGRGVCLPQDRWQLDIYHTTGLQ